MMKAFPDINNNRDRIIARINEIGFDAFSEKQRRQIDMILEKEKTKKEQKNRKITAKKNKASQI